MTATALPEPVKTGPLAELPASAIWMACDYTSNRRAGLDVVRIEPHGEDQVQLSACTPHSAIQLWVSGQAQRQVLLPGRAMKALRSRHRDADLLAVRGMDEVMLSVRTFSESCTVAWSLPEAQVCFERFPEMPLAELLPEEALRFEPNLLRAACSGLVGIEDLELSIMQQRWGLLLKLQAPELEGQIILAGKRSAEQ